MLLEGIAEYGGYLGRGFAHVNERALDGIYTIDPYRYRILYRLSRPNTKWYIKNQLSTCRKTYSAVLDATLVYSYYYIVTRRDALLL